MMQPAIEELQSELLRRIATQDRDALGEFYDQTANPLYSMAYRILGNTGEAEEVIQDVFVLIWTKAGQYDEAKGKAINWALSLTRHLSIDRLRTRQRRSRIMVDFDTEPEWKQVVELAPAEGALRTHDIAVIQSAVNDLPRDQRQAIELAFFAGHSHQEIAETLNEPLGTVKARIRRGMLKLREALQNHL
jgi:RNA polymerase sigma-70 factor (ECF subfamily)